MAAVVMVARQPRLALSIQVLEAAEEQTTEVLDLIETGKLAVQEYLLSAIRFRRDCLYGTFCRNR
jgi:hypothetical protein